MSGRERRVGARGPRAARDLGTEPDPALDAFFAATGADIRTSDEPQAYYNPAADHIHMPPIATFHDAAGYYGTLAHEACHNAEVRIMPRRSARLIGLRLGRRGVSA